MATRKTARDDDDDGRSEGQDTGAADPPAPPPTGPSEAGYRQEDAWPPRSGGPVDPRLTRETARQEGIQRDAQKERAEKSKETMAKFAEQFTKDMPYEVTQANKFEPKPDEPIEAGEVDDGWYVTNNAWAIEVKDGKIARALGPGHPGRPSQFVAV